MKKTVVLLTTLAMCLSLCACGVTGNQLPDENVSDYEDVVPEETSIPEEPSIPKIIKNAELQYPAANDLFKYNVYDTYVEITEYIGENGLDEIVIPAELEGLPVYVVSSGALKQCKVRTIIFEEGIYRISTSFSSTDVVNVVLPSTLDTIDWGTFENCYDLETVVIPEGVSGISNRAFKGCSSLKEVTIPSTVTYISDEAFSLCSAMESVNLVDGLRKIYDEAFSSCKSLKTLSIPNTVKSMGDDVFLRSGLETIELPETLEQIGSGFFAGCDALTSVTVYNDDLELLPTDGFDFSLIFSQCNPDLVVYGGAGSTIAKQCAREKVFFELME